VSSQAFEKRIGAVPQAFFDPNFRIFHLKNHEALAQSPPYIRRGATDGKEETD
jgi:hypothetical protein